MNCIILAAGYATRMYPLTEFIAKPLLEVGGRSIIDWLIDDIDSIDAVERVTVVSNHKFIDQFKAWARYRKLQKPLDVLDDGSVSNDARLGAARDMLLASRAHKGDALVLAGDNLLDFSLKGFTDEFVLRKRSLIMYYVEPDVEKRRKTGIITLDEKNRVTSFQEKPSMPASEFAVPPFYAYTQSDLDLLPKALESGVSADAPGSFAGWLSRESELYAWRMTGLRYDVGSIDGYNDIKAKYHVREL